MDNTEKIEKKPIRVAAYPCQQLDYQFAQWAESQGLTRTDALTLIIKVMVGDQMTDTISQIEKTVNRLEKQLAT